MLDFSKLTTETGGRIEIVFEDGNFAHQDINLSQDDFLQKIREIVNESGLSANEGEVVYLLFNSYGRSRCMNKSDYDEWNNAEKKDWGYEEIPVPPFIGAIMDALSIIGVFDGLPASDNITIEVYDMNVGRFAGPSDEQLNEIDNFDLDENDSRIPYILKNHRCELCLVTDCETRSSSFSMEAFEEFFGLATKS